MYKSNNNKVNNTRCPKCNSTNTVRPIKSYYNGGGSSKKSYYCCDCLIEFTNDFIRVYDSNGNWQRNIYNREGVR